MIASLLFCIIAFTFTRNLNTDIFYIEIKAKRTFNALSILELITIGITHIFFFLHTMIFRIQLITTIARIAFSFFNSKIKAIKRYLGANIVIIKIESIRTFNTFSILKLIAIGITHFFFFLHTMIFRIQLITTIARIAFSFFNSKIKAINRYLCTNIVIIKIESIRTFNTFSIFKFITVRITYIIFFLNTNIFFIKFIAIVAF